MGSELKVGDLAITLIDLTPVMAGSVVELIMRVEKGDAVDTPQGVMYARANGWICAHHLAPGNCGYEDGSLMPLRGDFEPEQQKAREVEPCA